MEVERIDGSKVKKMFEEEADLLAEFTTVLTDPSVLKITVWPAKRIPGKRGGKKK